MRSQFEVKSRLTQYRGAQWLYRSYGYIAWQISTGENIEIVLIEAAEKRLGHGQALWKELCQHLILTTPPYNSVFTYHRWANQEAEKFYNKLGFLYVLVPALYRNEHAVLRVAKFPTLCAHLGV